MKAPNKFTYPPRTPGKYEERGFKMVSPGIHYYADEIKSGNPFSFIRWGEGEWRHGVPAIPRKPFHNREIFRDTWTLEDEPSHALEAAMRNHHDHDRYWCAIWHLAWMDHRNWAKPMRAWMRKHNLWEVRWHDGWVWRRAIQQGKFYPIVAAVRKQRLPVCVVGPPTLSELWDKLDITYRVEIDPWRAYYQLDIITETVRHFAQPALWIMCGGGPIKIIINRLFPEIGDHSYMIDFGAAWEGLLGHEPRTYFKLIPGETLEANWRPLGET